ncbi:helix-turn-helix domain-containing protein [Pseudonocardia bannensis]|uniref:helix-turn-helix domain-containing protein n=1 Tax=Pseudonocardia bannensis TaxID=630973 RepID=UPI0028AB9A6D|nr:helix-turn-helix domain-containing protein [Pseudonocardia bannensis]
MARRPSVFVRPLSMDEGRKLQRITRTSKDPVRMRRAIVVMMSGQGQTVRDITALLQVSEDYVRDVIHAFNERGFDALDPKWSGGRRRKIGKQVREWICLIARTSPAECGLTGFSTWSLAKLRDYLLAEGIVAELSRETLRGDPARRRDLLADHHHVEGLAGPGVHRRRCAGSSPSTTTHPPTAASSALTSSGH